VPGCAALRKKGDKTKEQTFPGKRHLTNHLMSPACHKTGQEVLEGLLDLTGDDEIRLLAAPEIVRSFFTTGMQ
jgi:hypothetical protein